MNVFLKIGAVSLGTLGEMVSELQPDLSIQETDAAKRRE